jgi:hypothetical protein
MNRTKVNAIDQALSRGWAESMVRLPRERTADASADSFYAFRDIPRLPLG